VWKLSSLDAPQVRSTLAIAASLSVPFVVGCTQPQTEVRVRDPGEVALEMDTPSGRAEVLPKSHTPMEAELPRTEPPYLGEALFEAHPIRTQAGGIRLRCDACTGYPLEKALSDDGVMRYDGMPADRLTWNSERLRMDFVHPFCHPGRYCSQSGAYRVSLVTDMSNVAEIRHKEVGTTFGQVLPWTIGVLAIEGVSVYALATSSIASTGWVLGLVGASIFSLPALAMTIFAISTLASPPYDERVYPR
jgi:hypothetical protein